MARGRTARLVGALAGTGFAAVLLVVAVRTAGAASYTSAGISDPGRFTSLATALSRLAAVLAGSFTLGGLVYLLLCTPPQESGLVGVEGYRILGVPRRWAPVWALAALAMAVCTAANSAGASVLAMLRTGQVLRYIDASEVPQAWLVTAAVALVITVVTRVSLSTNTFNGLAVVAAIAVAAPGVTGECRRGPRSRPGHERDHRALGGGQRVAGSAVRPAWQPPRRPGDLGGGLDAVPAGDGDLLVGAGRIGPDAGRAAADLAAAVHHRVWAVDGGECGRARAHRMGGDPVAPPCRSGGRAGPDPGARRRAGPGAGRGGRVGGNGPAAGGGVSRRIVVGESAADRIRSAARLLDRPAGRAVALRHPARQRRRRRGGALSGRGTPGGPRRPGLAGAPGRWPSCPAAWCCCWPPPRG